MLGINRPGSVPQRLVVGRLMPHVHCTQVNATQEIPMKTLIPGPDHLRAYRDVLAQFATGVTVVTAMGDCGPVGMTANSFSAVSLDPPLVLWCLERKSSRFGVLATARHFAIHVLGADQKNLSQSFARPVAADSAFSGQLTPEGAPILPGVLARFDCELHTTHDGGDHMILVGKVLRASYGKAAPLLFWNRLYGAFVEKG
jgi:flavin reductase (DIM6/NTAB) family NADH-FMN oxidoreductase RutF